MRTIQSVLVFQTAFIGDVILTLPLIQSIKEFLGNVDIDVVVVPRAADVCHNHPAIREVIEYDKRGRDKGVAGALRMVGVLRKRRYSIAFVPHRSLRSALVVALSGAPVRVGFRTLHGRLLFTSVVAREMQVHEAARNLSLLKGIGIRNVRLSEPRVHPSEEDKGRVDEQLREDGVGELQGLIAIAPGTVWHTKRWPEDRFGALIRLLRDEGHRVLLVGGTEDRTLCESIAKSVGLSAIYNYAGKFSLLQSAELIRRCRVLVTNDSAPMHLAAAVGTPVVAIFGATVPEFGFAPYGARDRVVQVRGLPCRPCSPHGGHRCPIGTFECMLTLSPDRVAAQVRETLGM